LDNSSKNNYYKDVPNNIQEAAGVKLNLSIQKRMKKAFGKLNIFDRLEKASIIKGVNLSSWSPPALDLSNDYDPNWYDVPNPSILFSGFEGSQIVKDEIDGVIEKRWIGHLINLGNAVTCPFFCWFPDEYGVFPQWNVLSGDDYHAAKQQIAKKEKLEKKEEEKLKGYLLTLKGFYEIENAKKFVASIDTFSFLHIEQQWQKESKRILADILRRYKKRIRQMREFGILQGNQPPTPIMHLYLNEILSVEEEVKPYLSFVKRAFQTALPAKKISEFNEYRNSHDGVEFDPETIYDQNKWQRAEVMKVLKHRSKFCT